MKVIIVDDEESNIENLSVMLSKYCSQIDIIGSATSIDEAAIQIRSLQPDLIFLDIQIGANLGFELLELLPDKNFEVIFVTAYDNYGIRAIKFAALDYILKPIMINELMLAVEKAEKKQKIANQNKQLDFLLRHIQKAEQQYPRIALPLQHEIRYVEIKEIVRCQADNTYTHFHMANGDQILVSNTLKEYAELLEPHGFIRTHQSHLVNQKNVRSWLKEDGGILLLNTGEKVPISRPNREKVKTLLSI